MHSPGLEMKAEMKMDQKLVQLFHSALIQPRRFNKFIHVMLEYSKIPHIQIFKSAPMRQNVTDCSVKQATVIDGAEKKKD